MGGAIVGVVEGSSAYGIMPGISGWLVKPALDVGKKKAIQGRVMVWKMLLKSTTTTFILRFSLTQQNIPGDWRRIHVSVSSAITPHTSITHLVQEQITSVGLREISESANRCHLIQNPMDTHQYESISVAECGVFPQRMDLKLALYFKS